MVDIMIYTMFCVLKYPLQGNSSIKKETKNISCMLAVKVKIYWKNKEGKFVSFSFGNVCTRSMVLHT